jgi:hypothetical protein
VPRYGNWIAQTAVIPEIGQVLEKQARQALVAAGLSRDTPIKLTLNEPCELTDPETGEVMPGFRSTWETE